MANTEKQKAEIRAAKSQGLSYKGMNIRYMQQMNVYIVEYLNEDGGRNLINCVGECKTLEEAKKFVRNYWK